MALVSQFLTLLLAVSMSLGEDDNLCPPPEDINPCTCIKGDGNAKVIVNCDKVDDVTQVRRALQSVEGIRRVRVGFHNCSLGLVPSDLFKGLHVTALSFVRCNLTGIGREGGLALEGLDDIIEVLDVHSCFSKHNELRFVNISRLHKLNMLGLGSNGIKELKDEWFAEGPVNLKTLGIEENNLEKLGDRAFAQLTNLETLYLQNNKVNMPKGSMFPSPANHLESLHLSTNGISSLPINLFSDMPALKMVFLDDNSLQRIPIRTWSSVWSQLKYLNLANNPLICDSYIDWTFKRRRPGTLWGTCVSPEERKGLDLEKVIEDNEEK